MGVRGAIFLTNFGSFEDEIEIPVMFSFSSEFSVGVDEPIGVFISEVQTDSSSIGLDSPTVEIHNTFFGN